MPSETTISSLLNMIGRGATDAYNYMMVPDYYERTVDGEPGHYAPEQWQDWYSRTASTEVTEEADEHRQFLSIARPRLDARLREYVETLRSQPLMDENAAPTEAAESLGDLLSDVGTHLRRQILGLPPLGEDGNDPQMQAVVRYEAGKFFDWLENTSLYGSERPDTGVTPEQMQEWQNDPDWGRRWQSDWRLTPTGQQAFTKLLDYNLLNAFQQGRHQPEPLKTPAFSGIGSAIGTLYSGAFDQDRWVDSAPGTEIAQTQMDLLANPSPRNAMQYALELARFAKTQDPEYYNSWLEGSPIPQFSLLAGSGQGARFGGGDTPYGRATRTLGNFVLLPQINEQERSAMTEMMNNLERATPIRSEGSYEQAEELRRRGSQFEQENWRQITAYWPKWIRDFNSVFAASPAAWGGELPPAPAGKKYVPGPAGPVLAEMTQSDGERQQRPAKFWSANGITPFHSTAAFNDLMMVAPAIAGDPVNTLVTATVGPFAAAKTGSAVKALKTMANVNFHDLPTEAGLNTAITLSQTPQTAFGYFTEPDPGNPVRDSDGTIPPADSDRYMSRLGEWAQGRQDFADDAIDFVKREKELRRPTPLRNNVTKPPDSRPFWGVR